MTPETLISAQEHHAAGRLAMAEPLYREILGDDPGNVEVLTRLGLLYLQQRRFDQAIACFERGLGKRPDSPALWSHLGIALQENGRSKESIESFRKASALRPNSAELLSNLGGALWKASHWKEAEAVCRRAIEIKPELPDGYANLGNTLMEQDRIDEALAAFEKAVQLRPEFAGGYYNLGHALGRARRPKEAAAAFARAVELAPDDFNFRNNLGCAYLAAADAETAAAVFENALKLRPDDAAVWNNLAGALKDIGRLDESIAAYRKAIELRPDAADLHSNLIYSLYYREPDPEIIHRELVIWNERHCKPLRSRIAPHGNDRDPNRRLRIGYVSADFWDHASALFLDPLMRNHDHQKYEIFCYAQMARSDWVTRRLQTYADHWVDTRRLSDDEMAQKIRGDGIDILVDLKLHSADNRLLVLAQKPAPVQANWLGYPDTTGLDTIDYRLTDRYLENETTPSSVPQRRIFLPDCFWCFDPLASEPTPGALPAASAGYVTFGCLNNFCKVNQQILGLWSRILRAVPHSRLLLLAPAGGARERVIEILRRGGADPGAVEFVGRQSRQAYLETYRRIDIGLDTFPYNGHTTSLDALWMGVPSVTWIGQGPLARGTWSQLCNLGLPDFAARDSEGYVDLAAAMAVNLQRLAVLREVLRSRLEQSPLMDGVRFARAMESAFRQMWRTYCSDGATA
jgi:protein O-GlcNAc transferase